MTVKQLDPSCVPTPVFLSMLHKMSDDAVSGEPTESFKKNSFTWHEDFSDGVEVKKYAMVTYPGEET